MSTPIIATITDRDFGLTPKAFDNPRLRHGARGIILNASGEIAILNKANKNEHKLIGGGIEAGEDPATAFAREALEESGCKLKDIQYLGIIREEKSQDNFIQESHVFAARVAEDTGHLTLTEKETEEGSRLLWLTLDDALTKIKNCEDQLKPSKYEDVYHTKFIVRRDYAILRHYQAITDQPQP